MQLFPHNFFFQKLRNVNIESSWYFPHLPFLPAQFCPFPLLPAFAPSPPLLPPYLLQQVQGGPLIDQEPYCLLHLCTPSAAILRQQELCSVVNGCTEQPNPRQDGLSMDNWRVWLNVRAIMEYMEVKIFLLWIGTIWYDKLPRIMFSDSRYYMIF